MTDTHYQPYDAAGNKYGEEKPIEPTRFELPKFDADPTVPVLHTTTLRYSPPPATGEARTNKPASPEPEVQISANRIEGADPLSEQIDAILITYEHEYVAAMQDNFNGAKARASDEHAKAAILTLIREEKEKSRNEALQSKTD